MTNELTTQADARTAMEAHAERLQRERALIKRTVAKGTSDDEFDLFMAVCERTGLDPFQRQIYAIMRAPRKGEPAEMTIQTGIDGYRATAHRTGAYAGRDEVMWGVDDISPKVSEHDRGTYCQVTAYRMVDGIRTPHPGRAYGAEYDNDGPMWSRMPRRMLEKCAEALALRSAFPAELSGVYTGAEMGQADHGPRVVSSAPAERAGGETDWRDRLRRDWFPRLKKLEEGGAFPALTDECRHIIQKALFGVSSIKDDASERITQADARFHWNKLRSTGDEWLVVKVRELLDIETS